MSYTSLYGVFKHYAIWSVVKDMLKFQGGIAPTSSASKRMKNTASGDYTSSGSANPVDLNETLCEEDSSGTPMSTGRRPMGIKASKNKGRGKATTSVPAPAPEAPAPVGDDAHLVDLVTIAPDRGRCWTRTMPS
ncbi:glutathione S-transferase T3-like [Salvia divinorum]|uniref:Glutathione S-transferase T3-like n=1 Tax=Salvia divinorum TaxID=28513 RepID=A0ABD1FZB2_SALDI